MAEVKVNFMATGDATTIVNKPCKCCNGAGVQTLFNGECIVCKACNGSGSWPCGVPTIEPQYPPLHPIWPWYDERWTYTVPHTPPNRWFVY